MNKCTVSMRLFVSLAVSAITLTMGAAKSKSDLEILKAGSYVARDVNVQSTEGWWGLFQTEEGFHIQPTALRIAPDRSREDDAGQSPRTKVSIESEQSPVLLVRGLDDLQAGPTETCFDGVPHRFLYPGERMHLKLESGDRLHLYALGQAVTQDTHDLIVIRDYSLHVTRTYGHPGQKIFSADIVMPGGPPNLKWAGDLDQDGLVDLFFDLTNQEVGSNYTLFRSTTRGPGIVERAASFSVTGC